MLLSEAIVRVNEGLGFRASGHPLEPVIIRRFQEAQRDLEKGKTLPKFLLQEDQSLVLAAGAHDVTLPERFLRVDDDNLPHFFSPETPSPIFLKKLSYVDAVAWITRVRRINIGTESAIPDVFVIRNAKIDFIAKANIEYTFTWNYYKGGSVLTVSGDENEWLEFAPDWLIGEAGYRMARSSRDQGALTEFEELRTKGRAAIIGDVFVEEESGGPFVMGGNL